VKSMKTPFPPQLLRWESAFLVAEARAKGNDACELDNVVCNAHAVAIDKKSMKTPFPPQLLRWESACLVAEARAKGNDACELDNLVCNAHAVGIDKKSVKTHMACVVTAARVNFNDDKSMTSRELR
jgi:hypothetical protein